MLAGGPALEHARAHFLAAAAHLRLRARRGQPLREHEARQSQKMLRYRATTCGPGSSLCTLHHGHQATIEDNTIVSKRACIYEARFGSKIGAVLLLLLVLLAVLDFTCAGQMARAGEERRRPHKTQHAQTNAHTHTEAVTLWAKLCYNTLGPPSLPFSALTLTPTSPLVLLLYLPVGEFGGLPYVCAPIRPPKTIPTPAYTHPKTTQTQPTNRARTDTVPLVKTS